MSGLLALLDDVAAIHKQSLENIDRKNKIVFVMLRGGLMRHLVLDFARDYERR